VRYAVTEYVAIWEDKMGRMASYLNVKSHLISYDLVHNMKLRVSERILSGRERDFLFNPYLMGPTVISR
jgi:hypothetical protein